MNKTINRAADNIRILAASMVEKAKSGHPGGAMGGRFHQRIVFGIFKLRSGRHDVGEQGPFLPGSGTYVSDVIFRTLFNR